MQRSGLVLPPISSINAPSLVLLISLALKPASVQPRARPAMSTRTPHVPLPLKQPPAQSTSADPHPRNHQTLLPWEIQQDRRSLSAWIDAQAQMKPLSALDSLPSSKQVAFAERLARIKRRAVPDECFRDKGLMSNWIDGNR